MSTPAPPSSASAVSQTLGSARYRLGINDSGGGWSRYDDLALNRWPGDTLENASGFFVYLRDLDSGTQWSAARQPSRTAPTQYAVRRDATQCVIERLDDDIATTMTIRVDDDDALEQRELHLQNRSTRARRLQLTSYIEIALAQALADLEHPAFLKLFVQTECDAGTGSLIAQRRPRGRNEVWPLLFHALVGAPVDRFETDRARFVGRGRDLSNPAMLLQGEIGNVLDPCFSLQTTVTLAPGAEHRLSFLLGAADDRRQLARVLARRLPRDFGTPRAMLPALDLTPESSIAAEDCGFSNDGDEYRIRLQHDGSGLRLPPMPWTNVIANPGFGCIVSETGAGGTWSRNSQANRLTPWSNDPVCDPHGEALWLRDDVSGQAWSPLPGPLPTASAYEVHHGFGYSRFEHVSNQLDQQVTVFVAQHDPVKFVRVRLHNLASNARSLSLYAYQQLVLGTLIQPPASLRTWATGPLLCARNDRGGDFAGGIAFAFAVGDRAFSQRLCCERRSVIGIDRSVRAPQALSQPQLNGVCGFENAINADPCFARQLQFVLMPGEQAVFTFMLGEAMGGVELQRLITRYDATEAIDAELAQVCRAWHSRLGGLQVQTAAPELDRMLNGWLPYQALASRIWGRTAFYQSSGAYGFRDQLQDAGDLCLLWPAVTRAQILLHARHQFEAGDVLHWWHAAPVERGLRTHCSDDLLWLPHTVMRYLSSSGDTALLDEEVTFLVASELAAGEDERYLRAEPGATPASIYEHCCRALDRALTRGTHGLPLIGSCDWNDGMNRVGHAGRGESVWLGFFLFSLLREFIALAERRGDLTRAQCYTRYRSALEHSLDEAGWDGQWYRRAYYDDGTPLGTHSADECRIDSLSQSWAVLSGAAPPARAEQAMDAVEQHLIDKANGLIRLLTPPFVDAAEDPGYIRGYVAGVRENGGQYTHAACWVIEALARLGRRNRALPLLIMLSPLAHTRDRAAIARYGLEPYVVAADIYGATPHIGRGGWSWYTGSAGWVYRIAVECLLGLSLADGDSLRIKPCVPDDWPDYRLRYRLPESQTSYQIDVRNPNRHTATIVDAQLDDESLPLVEGAAQLSIVDDGRPHRVLIILG